MTRGAWIVGLIGLLWAATAPAAFADKVTLTNGDVLHGDVTEQGGQVTIRHALLGEVKVARSNVMWITKEGQVPPPPAPALASTAKRVATPCPPPAPADPCDPCAPETKPEDPCKSPWDFAIGFGISNESGNTEKFGLNADLETGWKRGPHEWRWRVNTFYEEAQGEQTEGKYFSNMRYARRISPRGRLFGLWIVDRDDFADLKIRSGWFAGYAHEFLKRKKTTFSGAIGAGGVVEERNNVPTFGTAALLAQLDFDHEFSSGDTFSAYYSIIPYLDRTELSPSRLELRYAHPLRDHLDITAGFLVDYVPEPPDGIEPWDTKFTFGIRWKK